MFWARREARIELRWLLGSAAHWLVLGGLSFVLSCRAHVPNATFSCAVTQDCPPGFSCDLTLSLCVEGDAPLVPRSSAGSGAMETRDDATRGRGEQGQAGAADGGSLPAAAGSDAPPVRGQAGAGAGAAGDQSQTAGSAAPTKAVCTAGEARCDGSMLMTCRTDGSDYDKTMCPQGCRADGRECLECGSSEHACAGACFSIDDPLKCGTSCTPCPSAPNSEATCFSGVCGVRCVAGGFQCNNASDGCEPGSWDFEDSADNWRIPTADDAASERQLVPSTALAHRGTHSASVSLYVTATRNRFRLSYWVCGHEPDTTGPKSLDIRGRTLRLWLQVVPAGSSPGTHTCNVSVSTTDGQVDIPNKDMPVPNGSWTALSQTWTSNIGLSAERFHIDCKLDSTSDWRGTIYVDDITLQ